MNTKFSTCDWYILLWIIQIIHVPLNLYGDRISVFVLFALYVWSVYCIYLAFKRYKLPPFLKVWSVLLLLFTIYGIISMINPSGIAYYLGSSVSTTGRRYIVAHLTSMLPVFPIYVYSREGQMTEKSIKRWTIILVGVAVIQYYFGLDYARSKLSYAADSDIQTTNNMGYFVAMVMPLLYFWRDKPLIQYIGNSILFVFVLLAAKRGAIIVAIIILIMQLLYSTRKRNGSNSLWAFIIVTAFVFMGYKFFTNLLLTNEYFAFRIESTLEGDDSSRSVIYSQLIQDFKNTNNLLYIIFGRGANGTMLLISGLAHNDWLQFLIDMGIVGFVTFLFFWICAFSDYRKIQNEELKYLFLMVIIILLLRTFFSMSINDMYLSTNIIIGYCLANINLNYHKKTYYVKG